MGFRVPLLTLGGSSESLLTISVPLIELVSKGGTTHTTPVLTLTTVGTYSTSVVSKHYGGVYSNGPTNGLALYELSLFAIYTYNDLP